jgi:antitoxin VapB
MTLNLEHPEVESLVEELMQYTGESFPQVILNALREKLQREQEKQSQRTQIKENILRIGQSCAALPVLDNRHSDEILGYNAEGLPT